MANQFVPWEVLELAKEGYQVWDDAVHSAAYAGTGHEISEPQAHEEAKRTQLVLEEIEGWLAVRETPEAMLPIKQDLLAEINLMAKVALEAMKRRLNRQMDFVRKELGEPPSGEQRPRLHERLDELTKLFERNESERSELLLEPCAEPRFGLTIDGILNLYEGRRDDDTQKWIL